MYLHVCAHKGATPRINQMSESNVWIILKWSSSDYFGNRNNSHTTVTKLKLPSLSNSRPTTMAHQSRVWKVQLVEGLSGCRISDNSGFGSKLVLMPLLLRHSREPNVGVFTSHGNLTNSRVLSTLTKSSLNAQPSTQPCGGVLWMGRPVTSGARTHKQMKVL